MSQKGGDAGGGTGRPEWFWEPAKYGGILTDIGSHQVDQFLLLHGVDAGGGGGVAGGECATTRDHPEFQDFGDMMLQGESRTLGMCGWTGLRRMAWGRGAMGGCSSWGRRGISSCGSTWTCAGRSGGNHLFIVDQKQTRYIDCNNVTLPFGPQFVSDIVNRTHVAQDQAQCLLAAELVIRGAEGCEAGGVEGGKARSRSPLAKDASPMACLTESDEQIGGVSRREFVKTSLGAAAVAGFPTIVPCVGCLGRWRRASGSMLARSGWGGSRGGTICRRSCRFDGARIMAVCDLYADRRGAGKTLINDVYAKKTGKPYDGVTGYRNYHELLANKDIDAVVI